MERVQAEGRADAEAAYQRRKAEREAEYQKQLLDWEREQLERERERQGIAEERQRIQRHQELQDLQFKMERDIIERNRRRQQELVDQFYNGIVQQLNQAIFDVCDNVLASLSKNGVMTGRSKLQITNLIQRLNSLNILEDMQIDDQIARISEALQVKVEVRASDNTPYERIDTENLSEVLASIRMEADEVLTDLGMAPSSRALRSRNTIEDDEYGEEQSQTVSRRSRRVKRATNNEEEADEADVVKRKARVKKTRKVK